jgi:hypothetical protein
MEIIENVCPVCEHKNKLEAIVCGHCGAKLPDPIMDQDPRTRTTEVSALAPEGAKDWSIDAAAAPNSGIAVYVDGSSTPAHVDSRGEFVIGRKVATTSGAMLDLAPLGGYHLGLSRRHAIIRRTEQGYEVLDLGSVNGTWLNDQRLVPQRAYPLPSGSYLRLGRMRLFVLYRPFA